ncbi:ubiquitin carboxyl-terminal hydrolase 47-like [Larimichthys crocea]|uniref:ubiquitin carboxyl-terminal hydrolase 47-like n=1 Tax=Larimichthys crocea TaxID=215358 RepID=UPI000F5FD823|nr:ubiquitin carboxyl-terminal hydrolase 47-like [Larimichthys crocea]
MSSSRNRKDAVPLLQRPLYGLYNQGATCYLNSVLQVLFMTTEIHNRLDPKSQLIDQELRNIFEKLEERTCRTENITESLEIKNVNKQRDAAECLELILNKINKQASEVFQGQLTYTTKCCKGHIIIEETNPFWTLPLSLKDTHDTYLYSVEKGIKKIFQTKSHSGRNMVYCVECNEKTDATSGCEMEKSPQILVLLLKRFDFDYNTMSDVKSDCWVEVPRALQIKNKKYKLYGMVNHMGSLRGGHYTATILSNEDKTWYEFNDAHVNKVEDQPFAKTGIYNSSTAYLLVYRASGSPRDRTKEQQDEIEQPDQRRGYKGKERKKASPVHQGRGEEGDAKRKKVSSFNEDMIKADPQHLRNQRQNRSHSNESSPQLCKNFKKNPLLIFLVVFGCALIVILIVVLTTVNMT